VSVSVCVEFGPSVVHLPEISKPAKENDIILRADNFCSFFPGQISVADLPEISKLAKEHDITLCVDNTFLGPALQLPLNFGADIVIYSLTKSINGLCLCRAYV